MASYSAPSSGTFSVTSLKSKLTNIARPTLFNVTISNIPSSTANAWPTGGSELLKMTCKGTQIPGRTIGKIEVPFYGRKVLYPGDVTYPDWQITVISDRSLTVLKALHKWQEVWNYYTTNVTDTNTSAIGSKSTAYVTLYDNTSKQQLKFTLVGIFPIDIPAIELSWDTTDSTLDVQCTFGYDYFYFS